MSEKLKEREIQIIKSYKKEMYKFQTMTDFAFDFENNKSFFNNSIKLSRIYNVKKEKT